VGASVTKKQKIQKRINSFLARRPHRSFRKTKRRDYKRSLKLPGYWAFSIYVAKMLKKHGKIFALLGLIYAVLTALLVGLGSQDTYSLMSDLIASESGWLGDTATEVTRVGTLFFTSITGGFSGAITESQQIYAVLMGLLAWLTTVWLLRNLMAKHKIKLRDGLYSAGAPIVATMILFLVLVVQLIPLALAFIGYSAATSSGLLTNGIEAMLFWIGASLLGILSLYWAVSTAFALVIVTLPGMYPFRALSVAGDIVVGRRLRMIMRMLWLGLQLILLWALVLIPIILLDGWIKQIWSGIEWLPIVPVATLVLSSYSTIIAASYVYLLYRKVVEDESAPA
jgi:hypothetical protein